MALEALAKLPSPTRQELDFAALLEELLSEREANIRSQELLVVREIDAELPPLRGDRAHLRIALEALLDRAFPSAQRGGDLYLAARYVPARTGPGSIRMLLRSKRPPGETASALPRLEPESDLRLALATLLLESQGAQLTLGEPEGGARLVLLDLPVA